MDAHDLQRFINAQDHNGTYERTLAELRAGRKTSHTMWFVFPQIEGLGQSEMSRAYAISSLVKLRSSMTLFARAASPRESTNSEPFRGLGAEIFEQVLDRYFDSETDEETERRL